MNECTLGGAIMTEIIKLRDGIITGIDDFLDNQIYDWYLENGVIDTVTFTFNNGNIIRYDVNDGIERTEMMKFFARDFEGITIKEFGIEFAYFLYDYTGVYPTIEFDEYGTYPVDMKEN